ncbi:hypothetical protein [Actinophytocola xanthii]|uniref:hypothetical protein n=1 Tax=Actinophytocola xanthii TaxID=1912961 RepID=UPI0009469B7B|nr:hypothetical protein [Actinophytocola xanthii]
MTVGFNVTCSPGREAAAAFMRVTPLLPALVIYMDPVNLAIQLPPFPGGDQVLAKFCRELAREAGKLAAEIDPDGEPAPPEDATPEPILMRDEFGDSGAGN